jgi:hypothetical protein
MPPAYNTSRPCPVPAHTALYLTTPLPELRDPQLLYPLPPTQRQPGKMASEQLRRHVFADEAE